MGQVAVLVVAVDARARSVELCAPSLVKVTFLYPSRMRCSHCMIRRMERIGVGILLKVLAFGHSRVTCLLHAPCLGKDWSVRL